MLRGGQGGRLPEVERRRKEGREGERERCWEKGEIVGMGERGLKEEGKSEGGREINNQECKS